jgi:hypothetical protein
LTEEQQQLYLIYPFSRRYGKREACCGLGQISGERDLCYPESEFFREHERSGARYQVQKESRSTRRGKKRSKTQHSLLMFVRVLSFYAGGGLCAVPKIDVPADAMVLS